MERLTCVALRRHFHWHENTLTLNDLADGGLLGKRIPNRRGDGCAEGSGGMLARRADAGVPTTRSLVVVADQDDKFPVSEVIGYLQKPVEPVSTNVDTGVATDRTAARVAAVSTDAPNRSVGVELVVLPGADHGDVVICPEHTQMVFSKVESLLDQM